MKIFPLLLIAFTVMTIFVLFNFDFFSNIIKRKNKYTYGIIGAMDLEIETLVGNLENKKKKIIMD